MKWKALGYCTLGRIEMIRDWQWEGSSSFIIQIRNFEGRGLHEDRRRGVDSSLMGGWRNEWMDAWMDGCMDKHWRNVNGPWPIAKSKAHRRGTTWTAWNVAKVRVVRPDSLPRSRTCEQSPPRLAFPFLCRVCRGWPASVACLGAPCMSSSSMAPLGSDPVLQFIQYFHHYSRLTSHTQHFFLFDIVVKDKTVGWKKSHVRHITSGKVNRNEPPIMILKSKILIVVKPLFQERSSRKSEEINTIKTAISAVPQMKQSSSSSYPTSSTFRLYYYTMLTRLRE